MARFGKLSGTVNWNNGEPFSGYAVFCLVLPVDGSSNVWPELNLEPNQSSSRVQIPLFITAPIYQGRFNPHVGLLFNADITPPNSKYAVYYYDAAFKRVGSPSGPGDFFVVNQTTIVPPVYTLPAPSPGTNVPQPPE